tara:strand:+ start:1259 stop:3136 length:1878 start_codon:yes stop_codon:yes gene_type:complete
MYRDTNRYKTFSRRVALLGGGKAILLSLLAGRMYQLQVIHSDKYTTLAEENRINLKLLPPQRGRILDRFGRPLAINQENYRVTLVAEQVTNIGSMLDSLSKIIALSVQERERILREVGRRRGFVPITIRENLDWKAVSKIEVNAPELPGLSIEVEHSREYRFPYEFAHLLGYVSAVSDKDRAGDPLLTLPGFKTGKNGVERTFDLKLRGKAGNSQVEVNAVGRVIRELSRQEGQPGKDIRLTIDGDLQRFAMRRLSNEKSAAAAVLDVHNGDVLILSSVPSYNPNNFVKGLSLREWRKLLNNPYTPLINKPISGLYAPGSTFKMVVALAALEERVIRPDHRVLCKGYTELNEARFHCWKKHGHGWQDLIAAHQHSCDVFFYDIAKRVGVDRIAKMAIRLGLGKRTGINLPAEKDGVVPTKAWKRALIGTAWQTGETLISGIGQGFLLTTPLQLALMTARLANGQFAITPRITRPRKFFEGLEEPKFEPLGISRRSLNIVKEGMKRVTNAPLGSAYKSRIQLPGMEMSGKTGTVQVRRISQAERELGVLKNYERPWLDRDHALFVGYAPADNPRYAVAVVVEHGGAGSKVAAPIAKDLLLATQKRDPSGIDSAPREFRFSPKSENI